MPGTQASLTYTCARCLRASAGYGPPIGWGPWRQFSSTSPHLRSQAGNHRTPEKEEDPALIEKKILNGTSPSPAAPPPDTEEGAMSRRLAQATEDALLEGGRAGRQAVEAAGFSEELKAQLLERVEASRFRSENAAALAGAALGKNAGRGTQEAAAARAWTGVEAPEDTMLRMLDDARKPLKPGLRGAARIPEPVVDLRLKREPKLRPGDRLANARDKTSMYAISKDSGMTEEEREEMRKVLKERFTPGARAMPNSIRGLAALANERIEDAIARGQFKNIPRGKAIERDARADNPFIDTTEYIMNKMIQRQDIVPPWIEKQQELTKAAAVFRARLRNDWKRHAARTIASRGGTLQDQMRIADSYAAAERAYNPRSRPAESVSATAGPIQRQEVAAAAGDASEAGAEGSAAQFSAEDKQGDATATQPPTAATKPGIAASAEPTPSPAGPASSPLPPPFRLAAWEAAELSYHTLAISNLNSIARSYNLMAPDLAKKPYFSLARELQACYADVAPQLAHAIRDRAARPPRDLVESVAHRPGSVLARLGAADSARIYDSKRPRYGFREFWADLFSEKST